MKQIYITLIFSCFTFCAFAKTPFRVMFYNTENMFDTIDNPQKNDNEFLPASAKYWNAKKYWEKLSNIAKVITVAGEWSTPALIGLCEVENGTVLNDLTKKTPLKSQQYRYEITDCEDARGVNVALLYQREQFKFIGRKDYKINFPKNKYKKTRDILHITGEVLSGDTLDVFVCHLPSRRGGETESEPDRMFAASVVRSKTDSLMQLRKNPCIIIMGDMNDEPSNKSMLQILNAKKITENINPKQLYNLFYDYQKQDKKGSYKYGAYWNMLDQMIVSGTLLNQEANFYIFPESTTIFNQNFLMTEDKSNGGKRPKKTFHGMKYEGGFSDHLPIYIDFCIQKSN